MNLSYLKIIAISLFLLVSSYFLTNQILVPIETHNYFGFDLSYSLKIVGLMLAVTYLFSLSVGIWGSWKQYIFVALPPIIGISLVTAQINLFYGLVTPTLLFLLLCIDLAKSNGLKNTLLIFKPAYAFALSTGGLLFIFSVIGGLMVIISSPNLPNINIGKSLSTIIEPQIKKMIGSQIQGLAPAVAQGYVNDMNFNALIESQVNNLIAPYKNFLHPILAVFMFLLFQFYASITKIIFSIIIGPLFTVAKKLKFLYVEKVMVEKEVLKF